MSDVIIGFDSAWTDSAKNPGAISACVTERDCSATFYQPFIATFDEAARWIEDLSAEKDYVLIAIDQPTIVPNQEGCRPVDRVASSLLSRLGDGVQPARRGGLRASMFGDNAPIWRFLADINAIQNPFEARKAESGRFLMEIFPALALPAIVPSLWHRGRAAKYNPARRKTFTTDDWRIVTLSVTNFARILAAPALAEWLEAEVTRNKMRKADQDRLDAAICLAIGLAWRYHPPTHPPSQTLQIGDEQTGYMATVVSPEVRAILVEAAGNRGVGIGREWTGNAQPVRLSMNPNRGFPTQPAL